MVARVRITENPDPNWEVSSRNGWSGETEEITPENAVDLVKSLIRQLATGWEGLSPTWVSEVADVLFGPFPPEEILRVAQEQITRREEAEKARIAAEEAAARAPKKKKKGK